MKGYPLHCMFCDFTTEDPQELYDHESDTHTELVEALEDVDGNESEEDITGEETEEDEA